MKYMNLIAASVLVMSAWLVPAAAARADVVLFDGASFIQNRQSVVQSFSILTPGTITMTLTNIPWLDVVSDLTSSLTSATGVLGTSMGAGTESFNVGSGTFYAHWFGEAAGQYHIGVLGIKIAFTPDTVTTVPLPASLLLLLSGLGVLFGWQRRATLPVAVA